MRQSGTRRDDEGIEGAQLLASRLSFGQDCGMQRACGAQSVGQEVREGVFIVQEEQACGHADIIAELTQYVYSRIRHCTFQRMGKSPSSLCVCDSV